MARLAELPAYHRLPSPVAAAEGAELVLEDGRRVLDLYGGHCVSTLGAGDRGLLHALERQWRTVSFATNLVDVPVRAEFLATFGALLPEAPRACGGWRAFLTNSGAEANESALKAAFSATGRRAIVCFRGAFHGRTAGAEAVSDKAASYPNPPFEVRRLPFGDGDALAAIDGDVAGVILEPIQSLAGCVEPPPGWLAALRARCDEAGAVLVFDEVQTGNGRLGSPFAAQHFGVVPDVITTAKGAAGGLPIGVTAIAEDVAARIDPKRFGSTFGGGPAVLAAAAHVARRVNERGFLENVAATGLALRMAARTGPVRAVRGAGLLLGLVLEPGVAAAALQRELLERGVLVGTSNDPAVLRLSPPLTLRPEQAVALQEALQGLEVAS